ncbi:MAG: VanZ family protein [Acidobacteriota bacterium]|nr:VanZ family protein [Acidobacteriota bacterium]
MRVSPEHERRLWLLALALLVAIYSTLYVARPITEYLRERNLLRLSVGIVFALLGVAVISWGRRRRFGRRSWSVLALGTAALVWAASRVSPVEVKLHFVEYGLVGGVLYLALCARGTRWAAPWAVLLTAGAGWLDEGIQYLLPNRYYDIEDVVVNAVAGALAVVTLVLLGRAERRDAAATPAGPA